MVRSTLAAEVLSLQEGAEDAIFHRMLIEEVFCLSPKTIPIECIVDNKDTVEAVYSSKAVSDKLLRINIGALKDELSKEEITCVRWCPSKEQLANCLTKKGACGKLLLDAMKNGIIGMN